MHDKRTTQLATPDTNTIRRRLGNNKRGFDTEKGTLLWLGVEFTWQADGKATHQEFREACSRLWPLAGGMHFYMGQNGEFKLNIRDPGKFFVFFNYNTTDVLRLFPQQ